MPGCEPSHQMSRTKQREKNCAELLKNRNGCSFEYFSEAINQIIFLQTACQVVPRYTQQELQT